MPTQTHTAHDDRNRDEHVDHEAHGQTHRHDEGHDVHSTGHEHDSHDASHAGEHSHDHAAHEHPLV